MAVLARWGGESEWQFVRHVKRLVWFSLVGLLVISASELTGVIQDAGQRVVVSLAISLVLISDWAILARAAAHLHVHAHAEASTAHAQEAVRLRDEVLSVAAHELKNPAATVRGYAQLLERQLNQTGALDSHLARRALSAIDSQSSRLDSLLSQLLDISRIQAGKLHLAATPTDLVRLVGDAVDAARLLHQGGVSLVLRAPPRLPVVIDALRFEQVVTNLLDNAVKYSPDGGEIEVELGRPTPDSVRLTVRDHGVGIPAEDLERIFDRLYQVGGSSRSGTGRAGLGLGLYICRQIVELHGGTIIAEAPSDGGTRVVVQLPAGRVEHAEHADE